MTMQESGEMYLETILILSEKSGKVRSIDVAKHMGFSKPAVSRAMSKLKEENYIVIDSNGHISLSESGRKIAERIYERHTTLTDLLIRLGVDEKTAAADACKMEHDMSDKSFAAIKQHVLSHSGKN